MKLFDQYPWLKRWETLLLVVLFGTALVNIQLSDKYLDIDNFANALNLNIEKSFVVLTMAFVIINGEIDLSVASVMGLAATVMAYKFEGGASLETGIAYAMLVGLGCGLLNGIFVAYLGIPSLVVTLAGLIAYRGAARVLLETRSVGEFPQWYTTFADNELLGAFRASTYIFIVLFVVCFFILQFTSFGRYVYVIGNNREGAEYAGLRVKQVKMTIFAMSGVMAAFAGLMYAARLGNVNASVAEGFELDIITIVLLGGVSIFGGIGTMMGVGLSLLVVLNVRNGMGLKDIDDNTRASVVGALLILSVLVPNWIQTLQRLLSRRTIVDKVSASLEHKEVQNSTETI